MPTTIHDGTAVRTIRRVHVHDGTAVRLIKKITVHDGTAVRTVFVYLNATLNTAGVSGQYNGNSPAPQDITTGAVTVVVVGGVAPYTYQWQLIGVSAYTWTITAPTAAITAFTAQAIPVGVIDAMTFQCTVTDSLGFSVVAGPGTATVFNNSSA